jgi:hypothetical protein
VYWVSRKKLKKLLFFLTDLKIMVIFTYNLKIKAMAILVFLLGLCVIALALVAAVEFEKGLESGKETDWDNDSWETQRG